MNLRKLFNETDDSRAVSPVIGVILMVAITVILAAVIGTFVLNLGDQVESTPQASFGFDVNEDAGSSQGQLEIRHEGGDTLDNSTIEIRFNGSDATTSEGDAGNVDLVDGPGDEIQAGDTITMDFTGGTPSGGRVDVVYVSEGSGSIIATYNIPSDADIDS